MDGELVETLELLTVIDKHGPEWPVAAPPRWGPNETWDAINREVRAGNLRDAGSLTEQGRRYLLEVRARQRLPPA